MSIPGIGINSFLISLTCLLWFGPCKTSISQVMYASIRIKYGRASPGYTARADRTRRLPISRIPRNTTNHSLIIDAISWRYP